MKYTAHDIEVMVGQVARSVELPDGQSIAVEKQPYQLQVIERLEVGYKIVERWPKYRLPKGEFGRYLEGFVDALDAVKFGRLKVELYERGE